MLLSAEAAKNAQRADLENHLETAQNALQDKQQVCTIALTKFERSVFISVKCKSVILLEVHRRCFCFVSLQELSKVQAQLEEQGRRLQEKQEQCSQLETSLKDSRDNLLTAEQRIETLETQTKVSVTAAHFCIVIVTSFKKSFRPLVLC